MFHSLSSCHWISVSNHWTGFCTGLQDWTGLVDWISGWPFELKLYVLHDYHMCWIGSHVRCLGARLPWNKGSRVLCRELAAFKLWTPVHIRLCTHVHSLYSMQWPWDDEVQHKAVNLTKFSTFDWVEVMWQGNIKPSNPVQQSSPAIQSAIQSTD